MKSFLGKRAIASAVSLIGLIVLVFFLSRLTGDPTDLFLPDRRMHAWAAGEGIESFALAPELRRWAEANDTCVHGFGAPYECQGHWNETGHRLAGEALARELCARISDSASAASTGPAESAQSSR